MSATLNTTTTTTVIDVEERVRVRPVRIKLNGTAGGRGGGKGRKGGNGNNGGGNNNSGGGHDDQPAGFSPARYWVCLVTTLAAVLMTFAVLTTAYVARTSGVRDWQPVEMPPLLWLSTALILASSATFEAARRSLWPRTEDGGYRRWLTWTLLLGFGFLAAQAIVFRQLIARGFYLANNPHSTFFYILTGTHGVHLVGGIVALIYLLLQDKRQSTQLVEINEREAYIKQRTLSGVVALYWHFIAGLWIFLFALLSLWK